MNRLVSGVSALALIMVGCGDDGPDESSVFETDPFRIHAITEQRAEECATEGDEDGGTYAFEGGCLILEPAAITADDVGEAHQDSSGGETIVSIRLTSAGADRFDELAAEHAGERLAIVVGGEVVNAPVVQATEFAGAIQVSGLTEADADSLVDALAA